MWVWILNEGAFALFILLPHTVFVELVWFVLGGVTGQPDQELRKCRSSV